MLTPYAYEQEHRQLRLLDKHVEIVVQVAREDFPNVAADVAIRYSPTASQAAWYTFLSDVREKLKVEFIDCVIDRSNMCIVHRTLSLKHGGQYYIRQREESSVLEVLNTNQNPAQVVWPITKHMLTAKESLSELAVSEKPMTLRVDDLIRKPQGRKAQTQVSIRMLKAKTPVDIIAAVNSVMIAKEKVRISGLHDGDSLLATFYAVVEAASNANLGSRLPIDSQVDHVSLYRLAMESMNRIAVKEGARSVCTDVVLDFICETVEDFRDEIDIVVPAMQLLAELLPVMIEDLWKRKMVHTIMDTIQYYAPPPCENRPRFVQRLVPTSEEKEEMFMSDEDTLSKALNAEWNAEYAVLAAEIAAEIAAGGPRKKRKKKYKDNSKLGSLSKANSTVPTDADGASATPLPPGAASPPRSSVKSAKGRGDVGTVSFKMDSEDCSVGSDEFQGLSAPKTVSRQTSRVRARLDRATTRSRSNIGATATVAVPIVSFSKNSFQSGVFQSSEFNLSAQQLATPKSWGAEFVSKRQASRDGFKRLGTEIEFSIPDPNEFRLKPLPVVDGVKFRGLKSSMVRDMVLMQCMATMFKFVSVHPTNRLLCFRMFAHDEMCDIGLVCQGWPKLMEYVVWIVDKMMADHIDLFPDEAQSLSTFFADKSLMDISDVDEIDKQMRRAASLNVEDPDEMGEEGSITGVEFDEVSAVTMPSVEEYHILDWNEKNKAEKASKKKNVRRKKKMDDEEGFDFGADMRSNEARASVIPLDVKVKLAKQNELKRKEREKFIPEDADFYKPKDVVILCFAMVSGHGDLEPIEKEIANKWLHIWDDGSRRYRRFSHAPPPHRRKVKIKSQKRKGGDEKSKNIGERSQKGKAEMSHPDVRGRSSNTSTVSY